LTWRDLDDPTSDPVSGGAIFEDRDESNHRAYLNWTPSEQLSVTAELVYDLYKAEEGVLTAFDNLPTRVKTVSAPLGLRYFAPTGFFGGVTGTYVDQEVERSVTATQGQGADQFFVLDLAVGYRLPRRAGVVSLVVNNALDERFNYQDDSYREFRDEPSTGPYLPERTVMGRVILNF
jgi:hypothetical protein